MVEIGFFNENVLKSAIVINENFSVGSYIEVKHVRKVMNYDSTNRSTIAFLSRSLEFLNHGTFLEVIENTIPKRYKITCKVDVEKLRSIMEERMKSIKKNTDLSGAIIPNAESFEEENDEIGLDDADADGIDAVIDEKYKKIQEKITPAITKPVADKVDKVTRIVLEKIARFRMNEIIATRHVAKPLAARSDPSLKRRIAMFISRVFDYLVQEKYFVKVDKHERSFEIVKRIDPEKLSEDVADKCPRVVNSMKVLNAAFTLLS